MAECYRGLPIILRRPRKQVGDNFGENRRDSRLSAEFLPIYLSGGGIFYVTAVRVPDVVVG